MFWLKKAKFRPITKTLKVKMKIVIRREISNLYNVVIQCTGCSTRYRTRNFFNNSDTNEDIITNFEQEYVRYVRNVTTS
jgi:hypothetical protein